MIATPVGKLAADKHYSKKAGRLPGEPAAILVLRFDKARHR
jgi:hypothetical protein